MTVIQVDFCPLCGSSQRAVSAHGHDRLHGVPGHFPVVRCGDCGGYYLAERPIDLVPYYPPNTYAAYTSQMPRFSHAPGRSRGLSQRKRLITLQRPAGGRLLDVGCGSGDFLAVMKLTPGWHVTGLEPNAAAVRYARETRRLDVQTGILPQPGWPDATFDVITMWHVVEHVPTPLTTVAEAHRLLKPNGLLVVAVPIADSCEARLFKETWAGYDVPRHLVTFTRASAKRLFQRIGFQAQEQSGVIQGFASVWLSLRWWLEDRRIWTFLRPLCLWCAVIPLHLGLRLFDKQGTGVAVWVAHKTQSTNL